MPRNLSQPDSNLSPDGAGLGVGWVVAQGVLFVFFVLAMIAGDRLEPFRGMVYVQSAGLLIALFGSGISLWSVLLHGGNLSPFPKPVEGAVLIESGPYRFVRHPMYSGIIAFVFGAAVAYATLAAVLAAPAFLVFFVAKSGHEETLLAKEVPGYKAYRSSVRWRLIPWVV